MKDLSLNDIIKDIVKLADDKKAEQISVFNVAEQHWLTEFIVVVGVNNSVHSRAVSEELKHYFSQLGDHKDLYPTPHSIGDSESGWVIIDANSIIVHCVNESTRQFYDIDKLFAAQGEIYYY